MAVVVDVAALAGIPPGPQLAAALARIDPASVPNNHLLAAPDRTVPPGLARSRPAARGDRRDRPGDPTFDDGAVDRLDRPVPHAPDEVRAALAWSRRAADRECDLAEQLVHGLPQVYAAFLAGHIDRLKAQVFADHLAGLTEAQIATVCEALLPLAGRLTPGQLVVRLRRLVAAIDPRHYERRYRKALRDRTVCAWLTEDGTAVLCARGLSPAQAQAAVERIDLLAHAPGAPGTPPLSTRSASTSWPGCSTAPCTISTATRSSPTSWRTDPATTTRRIPIPAVTRSATTSLLPTASRTARPTTTRPLLAMLS